MIQVTTPNINQFFLLRYSGIYVLILKLLSRYEVSTEDQQRPRWWRRQHDTIVRSDFFSSRIKNIIHFQNTSFSTYKRNIVEISKILIFPLGKYGAVFKLDTSLEFIVIKKSKRS